MFATDTINLKEFSQIFDKIYDFIYENEDDIKGYELAISMYDTLLSKQYKALICDFCKYRNDYISSDREAAAFVYSLLEIANKKEGE